MTQMPLFRGEDLGGVWPWKGRNGRPDLDPWSYQVIMIDPPWRFENYSAKGQAKGPEPHYETMADDEIRALRVDLLADRDALLWLWATWPKLKLAVECIDRWGASYVTGGAWNKRRWGTGYVIRSVCEPFLLARWGALKINGRAVSNLLEESRRGHSRKPRAAYEAVERMVPVARRLDLFSRASRPGWEAWGNEVGKLDEVAA